MYRSPAAYFRDNRVTIPSDQRASETLHHKKSDKPPASINAGVMVLEPSQKRYQDMKRLVGTPDHDRLPKKSNAPVQDYLSLYFGKHWASLPVKFNWQPNQIRFLYDSTMGAATRSTKRFALCLSVQKRSLATFSSNEVNDPKMNSRNR